MKKLSIALVFLILFFSTFVVAASYGGSNTSGGLGYGMQQLIDMVEDLLRPLAEALLGDYEDHLFERTLFGILLFAIVYVVIKELPVFKDNNKIIWIITISISILSIRFLTETQLVETILLPYSVLGVALNAALPIIIYFYFVESFDQSPTVRKLLWIFYIVIFVGLWDSRYDDLGTISWIYMMSAIAALLFLLFDGTIRRAIIKQQMKQLGIENRENFAIQIRKQLDELNENYRKDYMSQAHYEKAQKRLNKQLLAIMKN